MIGELGEGEQNTKLWRNNGRDYDNITRSQAISQWPVKVKNAIVKGSANRNLDGYTKLSDAGESV